MCNQKPFYWITMKEGVVQKLEDLLGMNYSITSILKQNVSLKQIVREIEVYKNLKNH